MIRFAYPALLGLLALALVPLLRRRRQAMGYSSLRVLPADRASRVLGWVERTLMGLVIAVLVVGLSQPSLVPSAERRWTKASVTLFVLDQSGSMTAPLYGTGLLEHRYGPVQSRLTIALQAVKEIMRRRPQDALGLVGFGSGPIVYAFPDTDHRMLREALDNPHPDMGDTLIDLALERALGALGDLGIPGGRAVVLVSDGEGRVLEATDLARRFVESGTFLYWVQVGPGSSWMTQGLEAMMAAMGPWGQRFTAQGADLARLLDELSQLHQAPMPLVYPAQPFPLASLAWKIAGVLLVALGIFVWERRWYSCGGTCAS